MLLKKNFLKPVLSIELIGVKRFWLGILTGFLMSVILYLFFNMLRDGIRNSFPIEETLILNNNLLYKINLFLAAAALVFSFHITLNIWIERKRISFSKHKIRLKFAREYNSFVALNSFSWIFRAATIYCFLLCSAFQIDFSYFSDYMYIFFILLLLIYLSEWHVTSLVYKSGKYLLISLIVIIALSFIFAKYNYMNNALFNRGFKDEVIFKYDYLENELTKTEKMGIHFDEYTKKALHYRRSHVTKQYLQFIYNLKYDRKPIKKLKLLVLYKIFLHNFYFYALNSFYDDPYIIESLKFFDPDKNKYEVKVIFEILNEYNFIHNSKVIYGNINLQSLSTNQLKRYEIIQNNLNMNAYWDDTYNEKHREELNKSLRRLLNDPKYKDYRHIIENQEFIQK